MAHTKQKRPTAAATPFQSSPSKRERVRKKCINRCVLGRFYLLKDHKKKHQPMDHKAQLTTKIDAKDKQVILFFSAIIQLMIGDLQPLTTEWGKRSHYIRHHRHGKEATNNLNTNNHSTHTHILSHLRHIQQTATPVMQMLYA